MATGSTKSRKGRPERTAAPKSATAPMRTDIELSERAWQITALAIVLLAAFLRCYDLNLVPLHHDEGVNGNFLVRLVRDGFYRYDPANYHGPTLYYFAAVFPWLLRVLFGAGAQNRYGLTTIAIRLVPALFGLGTIALIFALRRNLGAIATLAAALLLTVSPGAVYLSRYFIHETLFVFFAMAVVVAAIKFYEQASPLYLILASISAALLFATKETAIITAGVLAIALAITFVYRKLLVATQGKRTSKKKKNVHLPSEQDRVPFAERMGGHLRLLIWIALALLVFVAVNVAFYSSFFTNYPKGVWDAIETFRFWQKTGKEAHVHPFLTYVRWLLLQESPLLVLGALGALLALRRQAKPFALFSALWAFGLIAAYSLINYKTPWLALSFIVPLALTGGSVCQWAFTKFPNRTDSQKLGGMLVLILLVSGVLPGIARAYDQKTLHWKTFVPGYQTYDLNFVNYDNDARYYVYVYAHTRRQMLKLVDEVNQIAQRTHQGAATGITIVSPDYWPLPWYFRDYSRVGYYGRMSPSNEPIIIASSAQATEVQATFGDRYQQVQSGFNAEGSFPLRPGVDLLLFTRRELLP